HENHSGRLSSHHLAGVPGARGAGPAGGAGGSGTRAQRRRGLLGPVSRDGPDAAGAPGTARLRAFPLRPRVSEIFEQGSTPWARILLQGTTRHRSRAAPRSADALPGTRQRGCMHNPTNCPDAEDYEEMLRGRLSSWEVTRLTDHLERCDRCAATVK